MDTARDLAHLGARRGGYIGLCHAELRYVVIEIRQPWLNQDACAGTRESWYLGGGQPWVCSMQSKFAVRPVLFVKTPNREESHPGALRHGQEGIRRAREDERSL
jgi:hypothetical protein